MGGIVGGGGGGGGGGNTTTIQKSDPWEGQQPYLTAGFQKAFSNFNNTPPQFYPGSTVVPFSNETNNALKMQANIATGGAPAEASFDNQLTSTLNGDYLNNIASNYNNPNQTIANNSLAGIANGNNLYGGSGFNAAYQAAANQIIPQVNSQFESAGRLNSGLAQTAQTQALADAFASQYGQAQQNQLAAAQMIGSNTNNYWNTLENERSNQMRGMLMAPTAQQEAYSDANALSQVGAAKENQAQAELNSNIQRYNYNQNLPLMQLQNYMNLIQGNYGGTSTTTTPLYQNSAASALGGALGGASLGNMLFPAAAGGTAYGALGGAGLGLLMGLI